MNSLADKENLRVCEIFGPTLQGEGALIGQPTIFVRFGGCDYRCLWCDTPYAVDSSFRESWQVMTAEEILERIRQLGSNTPYLITLSGGNPAIQPLGDLIAKGKDYGFTFALETQGSIAREWFSALNNLTLSPKPPSSGEQPDWQQLDACLTAAGNMPEICLKIVVFDEADYHFARKTAHRYPQLPLYLQPGNANFPTKENSEPEIDQAALAARLNLLAEWIARDHWHTVTLLPQLHVLLWGNKRGV